MGWHVSHEHMARERAMDSRDVHQRTPALREGIVKKKPNVTLSNEVECDEAYGVAGQKGPPEVVKEKGRKGRRNRRKGTGGRGP